MPWLHRPNYFPSPDKFASRNVAFCPRLQPNKKVSRSNCESIVAAQKSKASKGTTNLPDCWPWLKSNSQQMFYAAFRLTVPFLLRSAHLFFIISDNRFLPSDVRPRPPFLALTKVGATSFLELVLAPSVPSSTAIARLRRSLSFFNSDTIAAMSTIPPLIRFQFWIESLPTWMVIIS